MKRFSDYLNEDFDPAIFNADGGISINDPTVVDAINSNLELATNCSYRTPYNGLEEVAKTLAYYKIFLPKGVFLDQNHGNDVFEVSQFGEKMGMNNDGEVVTASDSPLFVYFEWSLNEKGMYDTFACLCDQDELDEILADYDSEVESDEDLQEETASAGKVSKMLYKVVNQMKSQKQSDDVDSYIEHEKQGKTFTQVNEENLDERVKENKIKKNKVIAKIGAKARKAGDPRHLNNLNGIPGGTGIRQDVGDKIRGREISSGRERRPLEEKSMPDLKKKMGAKKATLPNMMRKEETVNEIADTPRGKEAVRQAVHRADATAVDSAINPRRRRGKKGKRELTNAMNTIRRGIDVHKKQGNVLDPYLKRAYGLKKEETDKPPFDMPTEKPSTPYKNKAAKAEQLARAAMREVMKGKEEKKRLRKSLREK